MVAVVYALLRFDAACGAGVRRDRRRARIREGTVRKAITDAFVYAAIAIAVTDRRGVGGDALPAARAYRRRDRRDLQGRTPPHVS